MSKLESIIVGFCVAVACPLLTLVAFWWTAASVYLYLFPISIGMIKTAALTGLVLGCLLDIIFLRRWVRNFYTVNIGWMVAVYLALFVIALAFFMGLPVGTFSLGIAAGVYIGRREHHRQVDQTQALPIFRKTALLTASVTTLAALFIGLLALYEPDVLRLFEKYFGLNQTTLHGSFGFLLIGFLCLMLFMMQYWCTL